MNLACDLTPAVSRQRMSESLPVGAVRRAVSRYVEWLDGYGEESLDFQSYYSSALGRKAKKLYYERPVIGTIAVLPMVFSEAFFPGARRLFSKPQRFPIADAHFAMGFTFLAESTGERRFYKRAVEFLKTLVDTRCPGYREYCWGYPFHWETVFGTIPAGTPLITTIPYVYEAFQQVFRMDGNAEWKTIMHSIAQHVLRDYEDIPYSETAASCSYTPVPKYSRYEVNANAYRAYLLMNAGIEFSDSSFTRAAKANLNFVLETQNSDGSWFYSVDGRRTFVDHFHTCFVLKALAKIEKLTADSRCTAAIERGIEYYNRELFDERGLPRPFSRAPRFTVYRRELYDYAECINLAVLLRGRFPALDRNLNFVLDDILRFWQRPDGSFRSRKLRFGWDNTPMHRWASSQLFRSMCLLLQTCAAEDGVRMSGEE